MAKAMSELPSLVRLTYVSTAAPSVDRHTVDQILQISRRNNLRNDVTGCLYYTGGYFAQVLEGRESIIERMRARLPADPRHLNVKFIDEQRATLRAFAEWSMGLIYDLSLEDVLKRLSDADIPDADDVKTLGSRLQQESVLGSV